LPIQSNIITINQNIPINGLADVTITIETGQMTRDIKDLLDDISSIEGVKDKRYLQENRGVLWLI